MSGNDTIDKIQNYNIELHNISFGYENRPIIQNVTLKIPEHRVTAIVGPVFYLWCHYLASPEFPIRTQLD